VSLNLFSRRFQDGKKGDSKYKTRAAELYKSNMESEGATEAARWKSSGGILAALGYTTTSATASPAKPAVSAATTAAPASPVTTRPVTTAAVTQPSERAASPSTTRPSVEAAKPVASAATTASPSSKPKTLSAWGDEIEEEEDDWDSKPVAKPAAAAPKPAASQPVKAVSNDDDEGESAWGEEFDEAPKKTTPAPGTPIVDSFTFSFVIHIDYRIIFLDFHFETPLHVSCHHVVLWVFVFSCLPGRVACSHMALIQYSPVSCRS
jgi:hypothetical protein